MPDDKRSKQDPKPGKTSEDDAQQIAREQEEKKARDRDRFMTEDNPLIFRGMD